MAITIIFAIVFLNAQSSIVETQNINLCDLKIDFNSKSFNLCDSVHVVESEFGRPDSVIIISENFNGSCHIILAYQGNSIVISSEDTILSSDDFLYQVLIRNTKMTLIDSFKGSTARVGVEMSNSDFYPVIDYLRNTNADIILSNNMTIHFMFDQSNIIQRITIEDID